MSLAILWEQQDTVDTKSQMVVVVDDQHRQNFPWIVCLAAPPFCGTAALYALTGIECKTSFSRLELAFGTEKGEALVGSS